MRDLRILLIGASVFQKDSQGNLTSKRLVVNYVHEFHRFFKEVIWATTLHSESYFKAIIDNRKVKAYLLHKGLFGLIPNYLKLNRIIDRSTIIFLHLPNPWLIPLMLFLKRKAKGFYVYVANDWIMHSELSKKTRGLFYSKLYKFIQEIAIKMADGVIARGPLNVKRCSQLNPNVIETVPIGLNKVISKREKQPCSDNSIRILYVGKLMEGKGVEILVRAFAKLCLDLPEKEISLLIVGEGPEKEKLIDLAEQLGIKERVKFMGFIDDKYQLSQIYSRSDILVVPSTYPEGVPRVIDEALLHGTPVVASAVGGIPFKYNKGEVILVKPGDEKELNIALVKIINNEGNVLRNTLMLIQKKGKNTFLSAAEQHARFILNTMRYKAK